MADTEMKNKNRRLAQNTMFLYMMTASTYILNFATVAYLTRVLGPSIYGQVGIAIGYMAYIQIVLDFGFILSATQRISERREDTYFASEVIASVTAIKLVLFCFVCCIFIMLYRLSFFDDMVLKLVLIYSLAYFAASLLPDYYYRGIENMKTISLRTISIRLVFTLLIFGLVRSASDVLFVPASMLVGNVTALVFTIYDLGKNYGIKLVRPSLRNISGFFKESLPFFVSRFASIFYQALNVIIFGKVYGTAPIVGYYTSCDKIVALAKTGSYPIADSLYPYMLENKNYKLVRKILMIFMPIITAGVIFLGIFAEPICVLLFGAEYREAGKILRLLLPIIWVILPTYIIAFPIMSPLGLVKYTNISNVVGMFIQITGLVILYVIGQFNLYAICGLTSITEVAVFIFRVTVVLIHLRKIRRTKSKRELG